MPTLVGVTPEYGIPSQEDGLLLESLEFTWTPEFYEQKNNLGRKCGAILVDEQIDFSVSGAVALGQTLSHKGAELITLVNTVPALWQQTPTATTSIVTELSHSLSNSDARKCSLGGSIFAFGSGVEDDDD